jgi:hypothetical protein
VISSDEVVISLSWRSWARAVFFTGMLLVFGFAAMASSGGPLRFLGLAFVVLGAVSGSDFVLFTRRWRLVGDQLLIPRLWSPARAVGVAMGWSPTMDDVGVRDSMFVATTEQGAERVTPNLMVARSDVMQWLHLMSEARRPVRP